MPLLGAPLLILLGLLTVAAPTATLLLWGRLRGPRPVLVSTRLALLALCQIAAVLLTGAALNNYGYFYGSWSELFGGPSAGPPSRTHFGATTTLVPGSTVVDDSLLRPVGDLSSGRLETLTVVGTRSHLSEPVIVYLPPAYFHGDRALPVVEVMTGYPGSELNLIKRLHVPGLLLRGIRAGTSSPMVLVLLRPSVTAPRDTECTDVPHGPSALTFFARDVPSAITARYGLRPPALGIMGDSTGGYCAVKMALIHPEIFRAAVALSGYYRAIHDSTTGDLWGGSRRVRDLNDPTWRLEHLPQPAISLLIATSRTERGPDGYASAQHFLQLVKPPLAADELALASGGHNFATWEQQIPTSLAWLSTHLRPA